MTDKQEIRKSLKTLKQEKKAIKEVLKMAVKEENWIVVQKQAKQLDQTQRAIDWRLEKLESF